MNSQDFSFLWYTDNFMYEWFLEHVYFPLIVLFDLMYQLFESHKNDKLCKGDF